MIPIKAVYALEILLVRYIAALILLPTVLATSATAADIKLRYFVTSPVIEKMKFNGIEGRAEFAITPPDEARPLTDKQNELVAQYRVVNNQCQGGRPGPETDKACAQRDEMNLSKLGLCYGLKDQSMAESEWHACRVSSYAYEIGSEYFSITCRPGESLSVTFGIQAPDGLSELTDGEGMVKFDKGELKATYSVSKTAMQDGDRLSIVYDFEATGASLLRDVYDGNRVVFPIGSGSTFVLNGSRNQKLRDEVARAYSVCK
ncbi:hypothetical protein [Sinorhizobium meliloti]|uniref:hypothetical protein n=1 Tax=Rhizobium meliloti TaxID=382 RepID=UPI000FDC3CD1|nr:hypothetical protein [Sinorhizobium meliloti]RVN50062.1 hypothetical protein CN108_30720 [Sinorhizobium meliloti]